MTIKSHNYINTQDNSRMMTYDDKFLSLLDLEVTQVKPISAQ